VSRVRTLLVPLLLLLLVPLAAAASAPPPSGAAWDYQLGGPRALPEGVDIVVRDRREEPAGGYDVCYVNAFQTQPDERSFWRGSKARWRLVLRDGGRPVTDEAWGEWLLDIRTDAKRKRLARIVGRWLDRCAADGFDAVELDNLDSFSRSHRLLGAAHAVRYARLLVAPAHEADLAVAQKNWVELGERGPRIGFDFAIAEECGRWRECAGYAEAYDDHVLVVEYRRRDFRWSCERFGDRLGVVLRDRALSPDGRRATC
jgi:hypothetical protein